MLFTLLRLAGYVGGLLWAGYLQSDRPWWHWALSLAVTVWGTIDHWKRPGDPTHLLRAGVWAELVAVLGWSLALREAGLLFLLLSPLARASVHLPLPDALAVGIADIAGALLLHRLAPGSPWLLPAQLAALPLFGSYAYVLGRLVSERDQLGRLATLSAFEREQRSRDDERMRIATHLHDAMGQYWTATIRALDVAQATDGDTQQRFIAHARQAALDGLSEMRTAVHNWHEGRQSPAQWLQYMEQAVTRFRELVGLDVRLHQGAIDWSLWADPMAVAEAIARTAIESLTNAVRHGRPTRVDIACEATPSGITVTIRDDGGGLPNRPRGAGMGTRAMGELAAQIGGAWSMRADAGGVTVTLQIPRGEATKP